MESMLEAKNIYKKHLINKHNLDSIFNSTNKFEI